uniref:PucR family transcriptional regulator n=1 Tax=candidate division WWE3 bacterium TaxID=2053526 RepID=A0A7C4XGM5_UNCKA
MKNPKENTVNDKIIEMLSASSKSILTVADKHGIDIKSKKYFEAASKALKNKVNTSDDKYLWHPVYWQGKSLAACALLKGKGDTSEEIKMIDGLIDEASYEYFLKEQLDKLLDPKSVFVADLLENEKIINFDQAIDRADIIGLNLRSPQAVILIKVPGLFKKFHSKCKGCPKDKTAIIIEQECAKIISKLKAAFDNYEQNIFACLGPDLFVCLKWARGQINTLNTINFYKKKAEYIHSVIERETKIKPTIGVGQYYPGLSGLRKSYSDAQISLNLGEKIWGPKKYYHIADVGLFVALSQETSFERKCELAHQVLSSIFDDKSLYKTVSTFLECDMNLTVASKKLHLHRNTLIYRLDKIKKETGLDPRTFSDAIQIKLGLMLYGPTITQN